MEKTTGLGDAADKSGVQAEGQAPAGCLPDRGGSDIFGIGNRICNSVHEHIRAAKGTGRSYVLSDIVRDGDAVVFASKESQLEFMAVQHKRRRDINIICVIVDPKAGVVAVHSEMFDVWDKGQSCNKVFFDHEWLEEYYAYQIAELQRGLAVVAYVNSKAGI